MTLLEQVESLQESRRNSPVFMEEVEFDNVYSMGLKNSERSRKRFEENS